MQAEELLQCEPGLSYWRTLTRWLKPPFAVGSDRTCACGTRMLHYGMTPPSAACAKGIDVGVIAAYTSRTPA